MTANPQPGGPARIRQWLSARTLRGRLVAGLLALLALACATVGVVTYSHLHSVLITQLNTQLTSANGRYSFCVNPSQEPPPAPVGGGGGGGAGGPHEEPHQPMYCAQQQAEGAITTVVKRTGQVASPYQATASGPSACHLTAADRAEIARVPVGQIVTVDLKSYGAYQMTATRDPDGDGTVYVAGLPLSNVSNTLHQVAVAEIAVFLAALLVTGVIGTAWVRTSLQPLRRVAATATRVTQLPLSSGEVSLPERVPDANPATEVGQVGAAFNRMLGHVESALARREASENRLRHFAADASHELRTPLAAIRGYAELARRHQGQLPEEVAHALDRVESESERMTVLVDELLLLARLDAGRPLASEPADMTRLVIEVTSDARVAARDHRWQLELPDEPVIVVGDNLRLHQVLTNLLSNAARHTPAGTTVTVALTPGSGNTAILSVTDNGPGIAPELLPDIFERFVRGDSSRSRAGGSSGLGLAIVRAVAVAHGGSATVESRAGETRFMITLPLADKSGGLTLPTCEEFADPAT
jgi:two-component system, OmpR family, sensor kinase